MRPALRGPPKVSKELSWRQQGQSHEVRAISWRAQNRLHRRYTRLLARRLQRNKAIVAIARELCGFIWELLRTQSATTRNPHRSERDGSRGTALTNKEEVTHTRVSAILTQEEADLRRQVTVANPRALVSVKAGGKSKLSTRHLDCWTKAAVN